MSVTLEVRKLLDKADHALEVAEELKRKNYHSDAASKVYYAMFYAAQALLKSEEIDVKKHSAVESSIGYYFAKPGRLDPKYHKMLINARKIREIADFSSKISYFILNSFFCSHVWCWVKKFLWFEVN